MRNQEHYADPTAAKAVAAATRYEKAVKVELDEGAVLPIRAHRTDAGLDLFTPSAFTIWPHERYTVDTGVHVELPKKTVGYIRSKSGLLSKLGILTDGVIDEGYSGSIRVTLINTSDVKVQFKACQKIAQLVIQPVLYSEVEVIRKVTGGDRGTNGFGSTGA